jgi:hypothetical protein
MALKFVVRDTLRPGLEALMPRIDAAVGLAFDAAEPIGTSYARQNAPWRDRTGNARNGLFARHISDPLNSHTLVVYHSMPYGFWLEVRWSGRYAIIGPTTIHMSSVLTEMVVAAVNRAVSSR